MNSLNRITSSRNTRSMVNSGNSGSSKDIGVPAAAAASAVGPGCRPRSESRGRRGRSRTYKHQYPEMEGNQMCTKEDYNEMKKQMEILYQVVSEIKNELIGRNIEKKKDSKDQSTTLGATEPNLHQLTENISDSAIAQNTHKINKVENRTNEINNIVMGMSIVLEEIREKLNDQSNKSYAGTVISGTPAVGQNTAAAPVIQPLPVIPILPTVTPAVTPAMPGIINNDMRRRAAVPTPGNTSQSNHQQQQPNNMRSRNQDNYFLNRIKAFKANCIIVFRIKEEDEREDWQNNIDHLHFQDILTELDLENLEEEHVYVESTRLGRKEEGKIRPIRYQLKNNWVRENIVSRAWMLKYSLVFGGTKFPQGISIARDLTQEDRANEKSMYVQSRQQSRVTGANAVPVARAAMVGNGAQANGQNRPVVQANNQSPPHVQGEHEGT